MNKNEKSHSKIVQKTKKLGNCLQLMYKPNLKILAMLAKRDYKSSQIKINKWKLSPFLK